MRESALLLANTMGVNEEHPDFPELDWQAAVTHGETREGYWEWVVLEMRLQNHAWIEEFDRDS